MYKVLSNWFNRYFSDEEAISFFLLLLIGLLIISTLGGILAPVFTSIILAFLMQGSLQWVKAKNFSHIQSVAAVFVCLLSVLAAILLFVFPLLWEQAKSLFYELPGIIKEVEYLAMLLPEHYPSLFSVEQMNKVLAEETTKLAQSSQYLLTYSINSISGFLSWLIYLILVPILVFFFLKDGTVLSQYWLDLLPAKRGMMTNVWQQMDVQISNYIRGKVIEIVIVALVTYLAFIILGVNYAALLAFIIGLSVLIPYIGAALATIPVLLIGLFQWGLSNELMYLMIVYAVIQALDGNVLVPLLFSEAVNLHPVSIVIAVLFFGGIWGIWGLFFAIPLATLIKAILSVWPKHIEPA